MLKLNLSKDGQKQPLKLNLRKGSSFSVEGYWDDKKDLDLHAFILRSGKIAGDAAELLTYAAAGQYTAGYVVGKGMPFALPDGSLAHSGDASTGVGSPVDEIITVNSSKLPTDADEVPVFMSLYNEGMKFGDVKDAGVRIKDDTGKVLEEIKLTEGFAAFNVVQIGSFVRGDAGWDFSLVGVGTTGNIETVLGQFQ
jgi:stress response protein SCP2